MSNILYHLTEEFYFSGLMFINKTNTKLLQQEVKNKKNKKALNKQRESCS